MTFKEQLAIDMAHMMNTDEFAEAVTLTPITGAAVTGSAVVNVIGESDGEWPGGNVIVATAVLDKATFTTRPRSNESLATATASWYIDSVIGETPVSWTVKMFSEHKPR